MTKKTSQNTTPTMTPAQWLRQKVGMFATETTTERAVCLRCKTQTLKVDFSRDPQRPVWSCKNANCHCHGRGIWEFMKTYQRFHSSADAMKYFDEIGVDYSAIANEAGGLFQSDILQAQQMKDAAAREERIQARRQAARA